MNTLSTEDRADQALRELLAQADPEAGATAALPEHLLDRVLAASTGEPADDPVDPATRRARSVVRPAALAADPDDGCRCGDPRAGCRNRPARAHRDQLGLAGRLHRVRQPGCRGGLMPRPTRRA